MISNRKNSDRLTVALREVGIDPQKFAPETLGVSYQMFRYRVRKQQLKLSDYHLILFYTGKSFEDLFPNPHTTKHQPIKLNLSADSRVVPPKEKKEAGPPPVSSPKEEKRFLVEDVYGGLPPLDDGPMTY